MTTDITSAAIAAVSACVGMSVSALISWRTHLLNHERFGAEKLKLNAELAKLSVETERIKNESDELRTAQAQIRAFVLEQELKVASQLVEMRNSSYPQFLEIVYRVRSHLKLIAKALDQCVESVHLGNRLEKAEEFKRISKGGDIEGLWLLNENMFKYRAFVDGDLFEKLHTFKRLAQDLSVYLNAATRYDYTWRDFELKDYMDKVVQDQIEVATKIAPEFTKKMPDVERFYEEISDRVRMHFGSAAARAGIVHHQVADSEGIPPSIPR